MVKSIAKFAIVAFTLTVAPLFAAGPILAPVDPLAWAVANADWGPAGGAQLESLRKVVNGQVAAHQLQGSYVDAEQRVVKRLKCAGANGCVMCSKAVRDSARTLRQQISNTAMGASDSSSMFAAMATYAQAKADALSSQARWNALRNENTMTMTTMVDGQEVVTTQTVKVENAADAEMERVSGLMQQMAQTYGMQAQQQGSTVYNYLGAATESLAKPEPAVEVYIGEDPLE